MQTKQGSPTRDKDFANIFVYPPQRYRGIVILRMKAHDEETVHRVFFDYLNSNKNKSISGKLLIVSKDKIRIR